MDYTDDVNGIIIGGDYISGALYYENRKQGNTIYANSVDELKRIAYDTKNSIKKECGQSFDIIYASDSWAVKLYN